MRDEDVTGCDGGWRCARGAKSSGGPVEEIALAIPADRGTVPALLWLPAGRAVGPVVLLGHGGSGHKRSERNVRLARWFAGQAGIASLAIDGPFHGKRAVEGDVPTDYQRRIIEGGAEATHQQMTGDWLAALRAAGDAGLVNADAVAFVGMSMGARFGLPVCATLSSQLVCAVVGKFGLEQSSLLPSGLAAAELVAEAARRIRAPVLQHVQWDDEVFPRAGQLGLFGLFSSPDKQLRARPGSHAQTRADDELSWCEWVADHLLPNPSSAA